MPSTSTRQDALLRSHTLQQKYEYCVVLSVRQPSWKDALLSRFIAEDRRMQEGREKAEEVLKAMRDAGLALKVKKHMSKDGAKLLLVFVTAELSRLEQQHTRLQMERWLQEEGVGDTMADENLGFRRQPKPTSMRVVRVGGLHYFAPGGREPAGGRGAGEAGPSAAAEASNFKASPAHRIELLDHILRTPVERGGAGLDAMQKADHKRGTIQHIFPLQDRHFNRALRRQAKRVNPLWGPSVDAFLRDVRGHFGEKVAFYYAFNAHYTAWLLLPSLVGGALFVLSFFAEQQVQQLSPFFAAFMAIWASAFIKAWKRRANKLALEWGVVNRQQTEVVRKQFRGWPRTSPITGELETWYPQWRRSLKYMVTVVVIGMQVCFIVTLVSVLYFGYFWIQSTELPWLEAFALNMTNSTIWGITLELLNWLIFYKLSLALNNFENHRTVQTYENRLIVKVFTFYFIDCFLWFFILAFFQIPFGRQIDIVLNTTMHLHFDKPFEREIWMSRLGLTIGAVLSLTQWSMVFFADAYVPYWTRSRLLRRRGLARAARTSGLAGAQVGAPHAPAGGRPAAPSAELELAVAPPGELADGGASPPAAPRRAAPTSKELRAKSTHERMADVLDQASMLPYDPMLDYSGIVIQFGYVTFFSVVWQLAPLVCLLHTLFRRNSNLLRLDKLSMRPLPEASSGIGMWELLLKFTASFCVLINCMLVSVSTDQLDYFSCYSHSLFRDQGECTTGNVPMTSRFLIAAVAGYVILAVVFLMNTMIPDQQEAVQTRLKKSAFIFKKKYWETMAAEQAMSGGSVSNLRVTAFRAYGAINYESDWDSGSDLSDAFEECDGTEGSSPIALGRAQVGPAVTTSSTREEHQF